MEWQTHTYVRARARAKNKNITRHIAQAALLHSNFVLFDHYQLLDNTKCKPTRARALTHITIQNVCSFGFSAFLQFIPVGLIVARYSLACFWSLLLLLLLSKLLLLLLPSSPTPSSLQPISSNPFYMFYGCFVLFNFLFICCRLSVFYLLFFFYAACTFNWYIIAVRTQCVAVLYCVSMLKRCARTQTHTHTLYLYIIYPPHYYLLPYRHLIRTSLRCTHSVRSCHTICVRVYVFISFLSFAFFLILLAHHMKQRKNGNESSVYAYSAAWPVINRRN